MDANAVVFERPGSLGVRRLALRPAGDSDVVVETLYSGVSTGTEKMLYDGTMPAFPGMKYPLVPGYESVGRIVSAGAESGRAEGEVVFVPGANCYADAAGLFGASADHLVVPGARVVPLGDDAGEDAVLLALAATAHNAVMRTARPVGLVIGHGVLGRLIARIVVATGGERPVIWETNPDRRANASGFDVIDPANDAGAPHAAVIDASGNAGVIDAAVGRLSKRGELVLAGFYSGRVGFDFAPAFMREISIAIAAEFRPDDIAAVLSLKAAGQLSLDGLVTHRAAPAMAETAYRTAFNDPGCLKMVIDWRRAA